MWRALGLLILALLAVYGLSALVLWQTRGVWETWAARLYFVPPPTEGTILSLGERQQVFQWAGVGAGIALPLLLLFGLALAALVRRAPVLPALGYGVRALAPTLACLLVLVYGGLVMGTLRQEAAVRRPLEGTVAASGPYFAARAGLPWPGPVR